MQDNGEEHVLTPGRERPFAGAWVPPAGYVRFDLVKGVFTLNEELKQLAERLEQSGDYRVVRRFEPRHAYEDVDPEEEVFTGMFLDVETTGLDSARDAIIELAMVPFTYTVDGRVSRVYRPFSALEDPGRPIPMAIQELTSITDEMVAGKAIDDEEVAELFGAADLVIAHNAKFDRPFVDKRFPNLPPTAWACSATEVPWRRAGIEGRKLEYIAYRFGIFFEGHRAEVDCQVGVHILAQELPGMEHTALGALLESARTPSIVLYAVDSPFEAKDRLKARGYRWNSSKKVWWSSLSPDDYQDELAWLREEIYSGPFTPTTDEVTAFERYR